MSRIKSLTLALATLSLIPAQAQSPDAFVQRTGTNLTLGTRHKRVEDHLRALRHRLG